MTPPRPRRPADQPMTVNELCEELHITRSTFYDWRAKRRAPKCYRLPNGDLRIRRSDFEDWFSALEDKAA
ncbi:helix-turn-helix domain-containing protein [Luedemannella flava]